MKTTIIAVGMLVGSLAHAGSELLGETHDIHSLHIGFQWANTSCTEPEPTDESLLVIQVPAAAKFSQFSEEELLAETDGDCQSLRYDLIAAFPSQNLDLHVESSDWLMWNKVFEGTPREKLFCYRDLRETLSFEVEINGKKLSFKARNFHSFNQNPSKCENKQVGKP